MRSAIVVLLALPSVAFSKIGLTQEECDSRYGEPSTHRKAPDYRSYSVGAFDIVCRFVSGKCSSVTYHLREPSYVVDWDWSTSRLTETQSLRLLSINGNGWSKIKADEFGHSFDGIYKDSSGELQASVTQIGVVIETIKSFESRRSMLSPAEIDKAVSQMEKE